MSNVGALNYNIWLPLQMQLNELRVGTFTKYQTKIDRGVNLINKTDISMVWLSSKVIAFNNFREMIQESVYN